MDNQNLLLGIEEAKKGNYEKAALYLSRVVQSDPTNMDGWLFLGHCLPHVEKKRYCYQRVLAINPQNEIAKAGLVRLNNPQKLEPPVPETASPALSQESPASVPVNNQASTLDKPKQGGVLGTFVFGFILALFICALPGALLIMSGKFDMYLMDKYIMPNVLAQTEFPTFTPLQEQNGGIDTYFALALQAINDQDCKKAIPNLDKVIELAPQDYNAYAMRAKCYYQLTDEDRSLDTYNSNLQNAMADVDTAILLQPADAELYAMRRNILSDIALVTPYQVDDEYLLKSAVDNGRKFISLSPTLERRLQISALLAGDLINIGQCEEGMQMVEDLGKKVPPGNSSTYGSLMVAAASGYACLGDMDKAVESMDEIISRSNGYLTARVYSKSLYLYQAGKKQQALDELNASIKSEPTFAGDRYYLRALIQLEMGEKEQALQDLSMGEKYTWNRVELYSYVNAKLALMDDNKENAVYWLQITEASLAPRHSVLHKQILEELSQLDAQPFEKSISVGIQTTPMPPVTPIP